MPWGTITLNDGRRIPQIAFGSATRRSDDAPAKSIENLQEAISAGFVHLDTAQQYDNERSVGEAISNSGLKREDIWITTKWSDGNMTPREACEKSLRELGVDFVDLYVIHHTWTCQGDFAGAWRRMEELQNLGYAKSIGLSAFGLHELKEIVKSCKVKPAVNMIMFYPDVVSEMSPLMEFMGQNDIVVGAYSTLKPLWEAKNLRLLAVLQNISKSRSVGPEHALLAWVRAKKAVIYTSSTSSERTEGYIDAGDTQLSEEEVKLIDETCS